MIANYIRGITSAYHPNYRPATWIIGTKAIYR